MNPKRWVPKQKFWGFDQVIAYFTQYAQQNDPQKEHLVIKVRISISYPNSRALNPKEQVSKCYIEFLTLNYSFYLVGSVEWSA